MHGGSLTSGDRRDVPFPELCATFVRAGIACASVNYRLGPATKWPGQPQDLAAAVAWVRDNIERFGGDPRKLVLFGHSSGCSLVATISADTTFLVAHRMSPREIAGVVPLGCLLEQVDPALDDPSKLPQFFAARASSSVFTTYEQFRSADVTSHVGSHVPPTLVMMADSERFAPPILEHAQNFARRMRESGRPVFVEVLPARRHMTALTKMIEPGDPGFARVLAFVREVTAR